MLNNYATHILVPIFMWD